MPNAIEKWDSLTVGHALLGLRSGTAGSVRHQVHDGDTIKVRACGNLGIRFLGVDAAETSFIFPGEGFVSLYNQKWDNYLSGTHFRYI